MTRQRLLDFNLTQVAHFEKPGHNPRMSPRPLACFERQIDTLFRVLDLDSSARLLDVGCGMGRFTLPLLRRGVEVVGLELSPGLLEELQHHAQLWGLPEVRTYCADMSAPPAELHGQFDAVVGFFTLHHVHDLAACMRGTLECVRPGGKVGFVEPNPWNPLYYLQISLTPGMSWKADAGILKMRRRLIFRAMREAGLEPTDHLKFGFLPPALSERGPLMGLDDFAERIRPLRPFLPFQVFAGQRPALDPTRRAVDGE